MRVAHHHADGGNFDAQLFRHGLGQRCANVLAHLRFAGIDGHRAAFADMQPGADILRQALFKMEMPPARFLRQALGKQQKHGHAAAHKLEEIAPVELKVVERALEKLVPLGLDNRFRNLPFAHAPDFFMAAAARRIATMMRG
jgi:hypothetical protein